MKNEATKYILTSVENGIQKVILNRPTKKNAFTKQMYERLFELLTEAEQNDDVRMIVFTANGDFFSSGNEFSISSFQEEGFNLESNIMNVKRYVDALIKFPKLLTAIVNGPAIGIAATMLGLFDLVYASEKAYFQTPFTTHGVIAEGCSTYTFPRIMGNSKAGDMLYLNYKMSAVEAKQCGLISDVYKPDRVNEVWSYLNKVSTLSPASLLAIKRLVRKWRKDVLLEINATEMKELLKQCESSDFMERIMSFMSRKSKF